MVDGDYVKGAVREATLAKTYFDSPPDQYSKLSGGALLDIGMYCLQFVPMMLNGERLESIQAAGVLTRGADESLVVLMKEDSHVHFPHRCCLLNVDGAKGSIQVVAVAARNVERAQEFGKKHSIRVAYGSYVELARDPNIDVVYIGVIHPYHLKSCLLFMDAKKNVLCEKPLAMNAREVKEILDSAKRNNVFLMEAVWSRFFPASVEIRRLLAQGELGEVKMVRAEFGQPLMHLPRSMDKNLGAGTMLDLGIYPLQFSMMVYGGEKPESIKATGVCTETGVDETTVVTLKFSKGRMAVITCSSGLELDNDAVIVGTKGTIRIPAHMWCPTSVVVNGKESQYPVPESDFTLNFLNSTGMCYEAEAVRQCLLKGLKESPVMSHADSLTLAEVEDEVRRQVGVVYSQDSG